MAVPKTIIISACDDRYMVIANDLFASIKANSFQSSFDLGLLDVGLSDAGREHFIKQGIHVEKVKSDIDYPARAAFEAKRPGGMRTLTARPFLRQYFPDYDVYIWLDADVWVQTPDAINSMIKSAANSPAIHIASEIDRCYRPLFEPSGIWQMYYDWYRVNYGDEIAKAMQLMPMLNAGVFAMSQASPIWDAWRDIYTDALQRLTTLDDKSFMADQLGLNILLYLKKLPFVIMPARFNWLTYFALPVLDRKEGTYLEPDIPHQPISQIHLTHPVKMGAVTIKCLDGGAVERPLLFSARNL